MEELAAYDEAKKGAQILYQSIGRLSCPALNREIHFTSEGFNHIIYAKGGIERDKSSQMLRFNLLPLAVQLVKQAATYQEYEQTVKEFEAKGKKKKKTRQVKPVRYWGLIGIIEGRKIRVIIKQIGNNGTLKFWSVIPAWAAHEYGRLRFFSTMKGNPEED